MTQDQLAQLIAGAVAEVWVQEPTAQQTKENVATVAAVMGQMRTCNLGPMGP